MSAALMGYFANLSAPARDSDGLAELVSQRATELLNLGETPRSLQEVLTRADRLDTIAELTAGAVGALGFGAGTLLTGLHKAFRLLPTATPNDAAQMGAATGVVSSVLDTANAGAVREATANRSWLGAIPAEVLQRVQPDVRAELERTQATMGQQMSQAALAFQTFSARNLVRTVVKPIVTALHGEAVAAKVDLAIAAIGSPLAGAAAYYALKQMGDHANQRGPAHFLAHPDFVQNYQALKQASYQGQVANGLGRAAAMGRDYAQNLGHAVSHTVGPTGLSLAGVLAGYGAATGAAQTAVAQAMSDHDASGASIALATQVVNDAIMAPVIAAWTSAGIGVGQLERSLRDGAAAPRTDGPPAHALEPEPPPLN